MESYKKLRSELLKNKEFRKAYDDLGPEFALIRSIIDQRLKNKMTQAQLARKIGTKQSAVARFESGNYNPTIQMLKKVAKALDVKLEISIS